MTEKVVKRAVEELGYDGIEVVKVDVFSEEAERLGILMTPTTVIEGKKKLKVSVIGTAPPCIRCNRTYARGGDKRRIDVLRGCATEG
jgi:hypothetical protein